MSARPITTKAVEIVNVLVPKREGIGRTTKQRPRIRLTIRQRMRVLDEWPRHETIL